MRETSTSEWIRKMSDLRPIPGTIDSALARGVALLGVEVTGINPHG